MPCHHRSAALPPQEYSAYLRGVMQRGIAHPARPDAPLAGFRIVVNPGNGGGAFIASQVLGPLGADVSHSIHMEPGAGGGAALAVRRCRGG